MNKFAHRLNRKGQATTEVVVLLPLFIIFIIFLVKFFGLLILSQKMEVASMYAARRWQLESHRNLNHAAYDKNILHPNIQKKVEELVGLSNPATRKFMDLAGVEIAISKEDTWDKVEVSVQARPGRIGLLCKYNKKKVCEADWRIRTKCYEGYKYLCEGGKKMSLVKYVEKKPRAFSFTLPQIKKGMKGNSNMKTKSK